MKGVSAKDLRGNDRRRAAAARCASCDEDCSSTASRSTPTSSTNTDADPQHAPRHRARQDHPRRAQHAPQATRQRHRRRAKPSSHGEEDASARRSSRPPQTATDEPRRKIHKRRMVGVVTSDKMKKTRRRAGRAPRRATAMYGKYVTSRAKYKAHDEKNEFKVGDRVEIVETPPAVARQALASSTKLDRAAAEA